MLLLICAGASAQTEEAPAPLYRDPVTDGAADPVVFWNRSEHCWWMLYTQRRANLEAADVAYCYGTSIGIAAAADQGKQWVYRGTLQLPAPRGAHTFWAPDIVYQDGQYHMFVVVIEGVYIHWGGVKKMSHYTSRNGWDWTFQGYLKLSSERVIDASLCRMPGGTWRMWYKDEASQDAIRMAESRDLFHWKLCPVPAISGTRQEGPKIFGYRGYFWMLTDEWAGMRIYRSSDATHWDKQGLILDKPSARIEDGPSGAHGDVLVTDSGVYVFYFTHPGRKNHLESPAGENGIIPFDLRRSSIQVAMLEWREGTLFCNREHVHLRLPSDGRHSYK